MIRSQTVLSSDLTEPCSIFSALLQGVMSGTGTTVMLAYRTSVQESTGCTPYYLLFGREARLPVDVMFGLPPSVPLQQVNQYSKDPRARLDTAYRMVRERLGFRQCRQKAVCDKRKVGGAYGVGEWVWLHCPAFPRGKSPKLHSYWKGPYKIIKVLGNVLYLIQHRDSSRKKAVVHFDRLKPCARRADQEELEQQPVPVQTDPQGTHRLDDEEENWIQVSTQEDNAEQEQPAPLDEEQGEGDPQRDTARTAAGGAATTASKVVQIKTETGQMWEQYV